MATNKNALIRYKTLDNCFRNPARRYFIEDLIEECEKVLLAIDSQSNGISRRQILDDIAFMESDAGWGGKLELERIRDGRRVYYRYKNLDFSINNMPLNELEINQLRSTIQILSQFKGMPQFEWLNELLAKLKQGMRTNDTSTTIMEFDSNQYLKGIERLGFFYNAIFYKKVLLVSYQPFESETSFELLLHPYFLKQYNNRWFLFGYNPEKEKYDWNLALDRITNVKEVKKKHNKNDQVNWEEYFDDIIGVTKPENAQVEKIVLHYYGKTAKYVETKPVHGTQKAKWLDTNTLEVRIQVIINYELERLILSYADTVMVIAPAGLVRKIRDRLYASLQRY